MQIGFFHGMGGGKEEVENTQYAFVGGDAGGRYGVKTATDAGVVRKRGLDFADVEGEGVTVALGDFSTETFAKRERVFAGEEVFAETVVSEHAEFA